MQENIKGLYAAFKAKDARFDGRFFVGISSTGIYCRPVCKARQPKAENCTFFRTAAAAEQAGYRPCLLCRPELAPGTSVTDATADLVYRAARMLERNCGSGMNSDFIQQNDFSGAKKFFCFEIKIREGAGFHTDSKGSILFTRHNGCPAELVP